MSEAIQLYGYQKAWINDPARFKIGMWSRQSGKSFGTSLEAALDCQQGRTKWVFLSAGERQSKELMEKAALHCRAINLAIDEIEDTYRAEDSTEYKQLEIRLANGSRIIGLPANPSTARGHSAHLLLDEFAFHKDSRSIWRALFPTLTRGYKVRIVSTPQGKQNKFYELWSGNPRYSKHLLTIEDAVAQGLPLHDEEGKPCSPQQLREAFGDEDGWRQEYMCEFLDEATAWLTYELISECEEIKAPPAGGGDTLVAGQSMGDKSVAPTRYIGIDVGRKRDLTVIWICEERLGTLHTREVRVLEKTTFTDQAAEIAALITNLQPRRVCMDATGLGMQLAEQAQERFGSRIEPITFTSKIKEDLAVTCRRRFEDKTLRIPVDEKIRQDLHSVKRLVTSSGNTRFDAERSEDGHADRFWALALCCHAAANLAGPVAYESVSKRPAAGLRAAKGAY